MPSSERHRRAREKFDAMLPPDELKQVLALMEGPDFDASVIALARFIEALDESEAELWPGGEGQALLRARFRGEITETESDAFRARLEIDPKEVMRDLERLKFLKAARASR